ncbi:helix-turn-helix domain-containing protein [Arthrobacter sp. C9C5]|uniref:helix-turn-helix domain-containing protein n=1 Tax=Arthrobacter sp. C9C5 TaxID=2735267 RepID=UPI001C2F4501|nr:helix-turn-helix domain-containing protein [Arthrobacter sp. C9C5]
MFAADSAPAYLTTAEVAAMMRVSKMTVYRLVKSQALAAVRFGKSYRIPESSVQDYIRQTATPTS